MGVAPLHVQVKSALDQTTFDIHHFNPRVHTAAASLVVPKYDYVVLSQGAYNAPTQVRVFVDRDDLLALYDKLTPIVAAWRTELQLAEAAAAATSAAPEGALL